jgi:hypothetical protein
VLLLLTNLYGFFVPLRSPSIDGYVDFAGTATVPYEHAIARLQTLATSASSTADLVTEATRVFNEGIAHVSRRDIRSLGLDSLRMRVPFSENWILHVLSYVKPDTYRDYEFCSYRRALERGTGRCGQNALALVSYLSERGVRTGFVSLGGHAIATAEVAADRWYLLDPDYGGVMPFDIDTAQRNPSSVLPYYWSAAARENGLDTLYGAADNEVTMGGPEARFARACPIEYVAYWLKWILPLVLLLPALIAWRRRRRGEASS